MAPDPATASTTPPLRADARRNRARVVEAAQQAFGSEGLSVPLDEIARRAGVGAGTVYRHFPTKESLFEEIVLGRVRGMVTHVREEGQANDPGPAFYRVLTELVEQNSLKKDLTDALAGAGIDVMGPLSEARQGMHEALGNLLQRAQAAGAVRDDVDTDDLTTLLSAIFLAAQRRPGEVPTKALAVVRDGLRPRP
jgi:AcrR family transcriptional regulator